MNDAITEIGFALRHAGVVSLAVEFPMVPGKVYGTMGAGIAGEYQRMSIARFLEYLEEIVRDDNDPD